MVAIKILLITIILASLMCLEIAEAGGKNQLRNIKRKKTTQNGKLRLSLKQATGAKKNRRNGKMNYYNSNLWPPMTSYYRPATASSLYLRSPATTSSSMFYPLHWSSSYVNSSPFKSSNPLRRTDDHTSFPVNSTPTLNTPIISMANSPAPTLYDMSAFTGNAGLMEHPLTSAGQDLWSMGDTVPAAPKPKLNLFNSFNYNDEGFFGGFLNQILN